MMQLEEGRNRANRLTRRLLSSNKSLGTRTKAIPKDHLVDDFPAGHASPPTKTVAVLAACPNKEIHRAHEAMAPITSHPILAPLTRGTAPTCEIHSLKQRSCILNHFRRTPLIRLPCSFQTDALPRSLKFHLPT